MMVDLPQKELTGEQSKDAAYCGLDVFDGVESFPCIKVLIRSMIMPPGFMSFCERWIGRPLEGFCADCAGAWDWLCSSRSTTPCLWWVDRGG